MDIPASKIRSYIDSIKPKFREDVLNAIVSGETMMNAFDSPEGDRLLFVISDKIAREIEHLLSLIRENKYNNEDQLDRIRLHCIGINKLVELIHDWKGAIDTLRNHLDRMP